MRWRSCCGAKVAVDVQTSCRQQAGVVPLVMMVSLSSMHRRLCHCRDGVVALVAMASLPSPMRRRLAVVGDDDNDDRDGAADDKVNDDDGAGVMDEDIDYDCDGVTGDDDDDDKDDAMDDNATNDDARDDNIDDDGDGATDDGVDDDDGTRTTDGNHTTDDDVNNDGYSTTDDDIDDNCNGGTDGRHRLDACGGCAPKVEARQRRATTGNTTTSRRTRCKWEERHQRTRGDRALVGQGCTLRGGGRVEKMRGRGIDLPTRNGSP